MRAEKLLPNIVSYSASISACEKGEQWQMALHLFNAIPKAMLTPTEISYNATISSCEKGQQWQQALGLFLWGT